MRALPSNRLLAASLAAILVAGCGGTGPSGLPPGSQGAARASAPPTATPRPATTARPAATTPAIPAATPAATPDVASLFVAKLVRSGVIGAGPVSGTVTLGGFEGTITGRHQMRDGDSTLEMEVGTPALGTSRIAQVIVGGRIFEATDDGPWFERPEDASPSLTVPSSMVIAAASVVDRGVVERAGQRLHRLVPVAGRLTGADLAMTGEVADADVTMEFYVRDDGSLVLLALGLTGEMASGTQSLDAAMTFDLGFDPDPVIEIEAPAEVWTRYTSTTYGYSIGVPGRWQRVDSELSGDLFGASSTEYGSVVRERQPKRVAAGDLRAYVRALTRATRRDGGGRPATSEPTVLFGAPAWRLTYHLTINGEPAVGIYTVLIRGRNGYWIGSVGPAGSEAGVLDFHERQLGTFQLLGR